MYILQVSAEVSTLSESLTALITNERSLSGVLPEVISKIARFLEHRITARIHAFEIQLDPLSLWVPDLDCLMPADRHSFEGL